ncbi:sucrase ferredoxin [Catenulispora pinisilvae]|uniref:sucrase ferredoxin n=1 Tax=Catenulispora pinisilvae TaxID=2705253 RepID=UPI0018925CDB|nr:sucrase ferredoxin [Catenulispora pinisilvae]
MRDDQLPAPQPHACSVLSRELGEPVAGTGAVAGAWLLLEQPGPWGRAAVTESRLDQSLGAELEGRTAGTGIRLALIRRVEDHHEHEPAHRRWYAASTHPKRTWLATGVVAYPTDLLKLDFAALDAGDRRAVDALEHVFLDTPLLGVCTNGKRDACCATVGRRVAVEVEALEAAATAASAAPTASAGLTASAALPASAAPASSGLGADTAPAVWEITHLGGHRFAPTAVVLPSGYSYGRLDPASASRVLASARQGRMVVDGCRGRSTWSRPGQVAELAVRDALDESADGVFAVASVTATAGDPEPAWTAVVEHEDGRAYEVSVRGSYALVPRPESCGKADGTPLELRAGGVDKIR